MSEDVYTNEDMLRDAADDVPTTMDSRGYRRLSEFMAWEPSCLIFPRFRAANVLNLLCLQSEVAQSYEALKDVIHKDDRETGPRAKYSCNFAAVREGDSGQSEQWQQLLHSRDRLEKYNDAIMKMTALDGRPSPKERNLKYLQSWLVDREGGWSELEGPEIPPGYWFTKSDGKWNLDDKLSLSPESSDEDAFTSTMLKLGVPRFLLRWVKTRKFPPRRPSEPDFEVISKLNDFTKFGDKVSTAVSSVVTTLPVIILHFCPNTNVRLGMIVIFTLLFSIILSFMSTARRPEVFAATAAFVAVQVEYVGSTSGATGP